MKEIDLEKMAHDPMYFDPEEEMARNPMYLDPKQPRTWGPQMATSGGIELPVRVAVLVRNSQFVGLRGPARVLAAIYEDACCCPDIKQPAGKKK